MTLRQKQSLFVRLTVELVQRADEFGYELSYGYTYRSPEEQARLHKLNPDGAAPPGRSCHELKLAIDFNLFKNGIYLSSTEQHRFLGEWWEKQYSLCRWGGRWGDGNHYSLKHGSRA